MSDALTESERPENAKSKAGLLIGLALAVVGAGGGYITTSGMTGTSGEPGKPQSAKQLDGLAFIPLEPMTVSIGPPSDGRYLRFRAELEVNSAYASDVSAVLPRVVDVMNTYLRSISMSDVEDPSALLLIRSQMRRRIDLVVGEGKLSDLLVMEFVVN